jgi:hypothetical protein
MDSLYFDGPQSSKKAVILLLLARRHQERQKKYVEDRRSGVWEEHLQKLEHSGGFQSRYHMSKSSFDRLVNLLDGLEVDEQQSRNSTGGAAPITKEIIVACGLRFLGGEQYKSIADVFHISPSSAMRVVNRFLDTIVACDALEITLPTLDELEEVSRQFAEVSSADGAFNGVVGVHDGFLSTRTKPDTDHPADYFSGHYKTFGLNVQAMCDAKLRFRYVCVCGPGKMSLFV